MSERGEEAVIGAVREVLDRLRAPSPDPILRMRELEPAVADLAKLWSEAAIAQPSGTLLGLARALRVEIGTARTRLEARGRALARTRRGIEEARGSTYDRTAARISAPAGGGGGQTA